MNTDEAVTLRVRQLCEEKGFSPHELSVSADIPLNTVKKILSGKHKNISVLTIFKLCDGFGITAYQFLNAKEFEDWKKMNGLR